MPFKFKKLTLFLVLVVLLTVGLVFGLRYEFNHANSTQTLPTTVTVEGVGDMAGLEFTMTLEKTEFSLGEPINITLAITNMSNETISVSFPCANVHFDLVVFNNTDSAFYDEMNKSLYVQNVLYSNRTIYWWLYERMAMEDIVGYVSLEPGENLTQSIVWDQTYRSPLVDPDEGVAVSPGTYYIVGISWTGPFLQTPPMQITISTV